MCKKINIKLILSSDELGSLDLDKKDKFTDLLEDHSTLIMKFQEFEENILKLMDNKQIMEKELEKMQIDHHIDLNKLRDTENIMKSEFNRLIYEKDKDERILKELKRNTNDHVMNGEMVRMINDLYISTIYYDEPESTAIKKLKHKKEHENIIEIMECLRVKKF